MGWLTCVPLSLLSTPFLYHTHSHLVVMMSTVSALAQSLVLHLLHLLLLISIHLLQLGSWAVVWRRRMRVKTTPTHPQPHPSLYSALSHTSSYSTPPGAASPQRKEDIYPDNQEINQKPPPPKSDSAQKEESGGGGSGGQRGKGGGRRVLYWTPLPLLLTFFSVAEVRRLKDPNYPLKHWEVS